MDRDCLASLARLLRRCAWGVSALAVVSISYGLLQELGEPFTNTVVGLLHIPVGGGILIAACLLGAHLVEKRLRP